MASTFSPVLALARIASCAGMPITSSISWIAFAGSAEGRSILFRTGNHLHALLGGGVAVRHGLRLDALRGVDHEHRAFARGERAAHLAREVDVPGGIDEVEEIGLAVLRPVLERRGLRLDRDAALALESMVSSTCSAISRSASRRTSG